MKRFSKVMSAVFTVFAVCFLFSNVLTVSAEEKVPGNVYVEPVQTVKGKWVNTTKMRVDTDSVTSFSVEYGTGDSISNLKVNKKGLTAQVVTTKTAPEDFPGNNYSQISLYGTKPGKYTVSFNVVDETGKVLAKKKMTVLLDHDHYWYTKASFGNQTIRSRKVTYKNGTWKYTNSGSASKKVSGKSGKFKVTAGKNYKITGIIYAYVNKNGDMVYKKIKNGGNVTLSQDYSYKYNSAGHSRYRASKKWTDIYVSYKDSFTGDTLQYSIVTKRGKKEVKVVWKNKLTGKSDVYYNLPKTFSLWQY